MVDLLPEALSVGRRWRPWHASTSTAPGSVRSARRRWRRPLCFAGIGEGTDVVGKEMYSFEDRGNRSCTLRPEGTASVVRAALQHGLLSQGMQKLWWRGQCFASRPQAGRQRQFHQIGVEGHAARARSDVEVIALAWDCWPALRAACS